MSTTPVVRSSSGAAARIADTLLNVVGGRTVAVRIASAPAAGDGGQLGQPSPQYQDYAIGPVVFRRVQPMVKAGEPDRYELLVSSTAVTNLLASVNASDAVAMFQSALGIVVDTNLMIIQAISTSEAFGAAYLYTLLLRDQ